MNNKTKIGRHASTGNCPRNKGLINSTALVRGKISDKYCKGTGSCWRGKNTPLKNMVGVKNNVK